MFGIDEETKRALMSLASRAVVALETIGERLDMLIKLKDDPQNVRGASRFQVCPTCSLRVDAAGGKFSHHVNPASPDAWCLSSGKESPK